MQCLHILHPGLTYGLIGLLPTTLDWPLVTRFTKVCSKDEKRAK